MGFAAAIKNSQEKSRRQAQAPSVSEDVREFHEAAGHPVRETPTLVSIEELRFRIDLIGEEYQELAAACVMSDLVEIADAMADIVYVTVGMAHTLGIPFDEVWKEVQRSNMAKFTERGSYDATGKVQKPADWQPPQIEQVLIDAGMDVEDNG